VVVTEDVVTTETGFPPAGWDEEATDAGTAGAGNEDGVWATSFPPSLETGGVGGAMIDPWMRLSSSMIGFLG
jgi:hypothetical protein